MGDQVILEEDYDENYEPTEEGMLSIMAPILIMSQLPIKRAQLLNWNNIFNLTTNIPFHSIDLNAHISHFEKATPILKSELFLVKKKVY